MKSEIKKSGWYSEKETFEIRNIFRSNYSERLLTRYIKIYAQTPQASCGPDIGGAPIFRKKNNIEEENNNNRKKDRDNKKSRIAEKNRKFRPEPRKNFGDKKWSIIEDDKENDEY